MPDNAAQVLRDIGSYIFADIAIPRSAQDLPSAQNSIIGDGVNGDAVFIEASISDSVRKWGEAQVVIKSKRSDFLNRFLDQLASQVSATQVPAPPVVYLRLGYVQRTDTVWFPWTKYYLVNHSAIESDKTAESPAAHLISLNLIDSFYVMALGQKVRARIGKVSQIVEEILQENQFNPGVIEETQKEGTWIQSYMSDYRFLFDRMLPRAINAQGTAGYLLYVRNDQNGSPVVHFHSPTFDGAQTPRWDLNMIFQSDQNPAVYTIQPAFEDDTWRSQLDGSSGVRAMVYDLVGDDFRPAESVPEAGAKFADRASPSSPQFYRHIGRHLDQNSRAEAEALAQSAYSWARLETYGFSCNIRNRPDFSSGCIVNIAIGSQSPFAGSYLVLDVEHKLKDGVMVSVPTLARGEQSSQSSPQFLSGGKMMSPLSAEGVTAKSGSAQVLDAAAARTVTRTVRPA